MATFDINEVARRVQSTSTGQDGPYTFNFQVNAASEIQVYRNDTLQTESTHYNTTLNTDGTGSITFIDTSGSGGTDHSPTSGDVITIIGDQPLSRTTVFSTGSVNQPTTLETEFDNVVIRQQQLKEMMDRSIQLKPSTRRTVTGTGTSGPLQFPYDDTASNNASKVIAYDSNGTSLELGPTTANLTTLAGISSDISTVAGISSNVTSVAGNATNINTVAGISSNITTVAGISSNVTTVAGISSAVSTVASANSNISTVASGISNVNTVAGSISNVNTTAGSISNVNTVAGSISNVNTVASNITGVNSFAERYRVGSSDPSSDNDAGDLFFNTTSNTLKFYDGSSFNAITSGIADSEVTTAKIADSAVTTAKIADNAVTTAKINADAITGAKIADDAIDSEHYTDGSIDTAHIADNQITNAKMADDSVGSAELIDNSVGAAALNISGNGSSGQMIVSDGDGSFSYADASGGTSAPTALSGTTPTIDWSANTQFTQTLSGATTYSFSNISAGASIELYLKNVGKSFDLLNQTHTAVSFSSQIGTEDTLYASFFNNDGSKFYIVEGVTTIFYEYNLSTNYDITSASFVQSKSGFPAITQSGFQFNADGTKLISIRGDDLHEHALTSAYNISTLNTTAANSVNLDSVLGDSGGTGLLFDNGRFNSDGTKLFISNERHGNSSSNPFTSHFVITLSSAYDITSTLALESSFNIGQDMKVFGENYDSFLASDISSDGKHMVVVQQSLDSNDERRIHHYFLGTAFDLSTIQRVGTQLMADIQTGDPIGYIRIHPDGENMHLHSRRNGSFAGNQSLRLFDIQGNHKVTFPTVTSTVPFSFGEGGDPTTTSFLRLTSNDGTNVLITDHREIS